MRWSFILVCAFLLAAASGCDSKQSEAPKDQVPPPKAGPRAAPAPGGNQQGTPKGGAPQ
jgi:hypothetical protein